MVEDRFDSDANSDKKPKNALQFEEKETEIDLFPDFSLI